ncbi:MAG: ATP-dependent DNA helicase [Clostridia bacterium]|nr:ATP-dependent DNA helicase [Clostridia bacterium]
MFFEKKEKTLYLTAEELLQAAWFCYTDTTSEEEPTVQNLPADAKDASLYKTEQISHRFTLGKTDFCLTGQTLCKENTFFFSFSTREVPSRLSAAAKKKMRGLGFIYAYLLQQDTPLSLSFTVSRRSDEIFSWEESPKKEQLISFWERALSALSLDEEHIVEKAVTRMPSLLSLSFPYQNVREGQNQMMQTVFSTVKNHGVLYAAAPTGTGKTMAVLFPALRALGKGLTEKIFYFVPKTTLFATARDTLLLLAEHGADVRGLVLYAKERICPYKNEGVPCRFCTHGKGKKKALQQATESLYQEKQTVVEEEALLQTALHFGVCPYELALSYARHADVVIGDYNYLFDKRVFLRRFFTEKGRYTFLIDEAHNLPDRAREMYSAELSLSFLEGLKGLCEALSPSFLPKVKSLTAVFQETVAEMLKESLRKNEKGEDVGFAYTSEPPASLCEAITSVAKESEEPLFALRAAKDAQSQLFREAIYTLLRAEDVLFHYSNHYVTYALQDEGEKKIKFFCIDPSEEINARLDKGDSAVFFSATLSPADYYRSVLTARRAALTLEVASPFEEENLCVGIMDKISVRSAYREETLMEVARCIATVLKEKQGNYIVFCPSFAYMERVAEAFRRLAPKVTVALQKRHMSIKEREEFLSRFAVREKGYFVGFCVTGGIYAEGIDLVGERLIGAIIVGVALPQVSAERELISAYYTDKCEMGKEYAYYYPGMNRILQAAGRVIRREEDKGVVVLIDDRFRSPVCRKIFPQGWHGLKYAGNREALAELLRRFWQKEQQ